MKDHVELFLDTSGVSLHKRGYRREANLAPLHETMAAAMVNLARYRGRDFFWDPFCGSGTICIEAAMIALNRAPGLNRSFMAQKWSCVPKRSGSRPERKRSTASTGGEYHILGSDIDPASLEIAQQNARKAGVGKLIEFREADATKMSLPADKGPHRLQPALRRAHARAAQRPAALQRLRAAPQIRGRLEKNTSSPPNRSSSITTANRPSKSANSTTDGLQCNVYMYY